jgi:uncharacterized Zn finger protein
LSQAPTPSPQPQQPSAPPLANQGPPAPGTPGFRPGATYQPRQVKPRKVRGGIRFAHADPAFPESWPAQRWMRIIEGCASPEALTGGLEYAKLGQTRRMTTDPGKIKGAVQGTIISSYDTTITLPVLAHEQSERIIAAMVDQAVYAAKLLAGELPANPPIEDLFAAHGLRLFPDPSELKNTCNCRDLIKPWCKHACCLAYLVAEQFTRDPFTIFTLRGLPREELLERLRQRRLVAGSGAGSALVYAPVIPGVSDAPSPPLEEVADRFWEAGPELEHLDTPIAPPDVSHPLLRRLGPSPFGPAGRFPLVGLLATSYGMISEAILKRAEAEGEITGEGAEAQETEGPAEGDDEQPGTDAV